MRMCRRFALGFWVSVALAGGTAIASEPVELDAAQLDRVAGGAGFAFFIGAASAGFSGAGESSIEGSGSATFNEEISVAPDGSVTKWTRKASGYYKGWAKARAKGGTASAALSAGSGVVLN